MQSGPGLSAQEMEKRAVETNTFLNLVSRLNDATNPEQSEFAVRNILNLMHQMAADNHFEGILTGLSAINDENTRKSIAQTRDEYGWGLLHHAAWNGNGDAISRLVNEHNLDINQLTQLKQTQMGSIPSGLDDMSPLDLVLASRFLTLNSRLTTSVTAAIVSQGGEFHDFKGEIGSPKAMSEYAHAKGNQIFTDQMEVVEIKGERAVEEFKALNKKRPLGSHVEVVEYPDGQLIELMYPASTAGVYQGFANAGRPIEVIVEDEIDEIVAADLNPVLADEEMQEAPLQTSSVRDSSNYAAMVKRQDLGSAQEEDSNSAPDMSAEEPEDIQLLRFQQELGIGPFSKEEKEAVDRLQSAAKQDADDEAKQIGIQIFKQIALKNNGRKFDLNSIKENIHLLAKNQRFDLVIPLLLSIKDEELRKEILDSRNNGFGLLHTAVEKGHVGAVEVLLKLGADPNLKIDQKGNARFHGMTPLDLMVASQSLARNYQNDIIEKIAKQLLIHGAKFGFKEKPGTQDLLDYAKTNGNNNFTRQEIVQYSQASAEANRAIKAQASQPQAAEVEKTSQWKQSQQKLHKFTHKLAGKVGLFIHERAKQVESKVQEIKHHIEEHRSRKR